MQQDAAAVQTAGQLSALRGVPLSADTPDVCNVEKQIVDKYLGCRYLHRGRTMAGMDCWGFMKLVYADFGIRLFDIEDYEKAWGLKGKNYFEENYVHDWDKADTPNIFDGVLFLNSRGIADHAGIVLSNRRFIHCCRAGVVVSRLDDQSWKQKIEGFYRLKK